MKNSGQIVLFQFPQTNLTQGKLRPALLIGRLPGPYDDWLICMISSQLQHVVPGFDEIIQPQDADFAASGLKSASVIRIGRFAVVDGAVLVGSIGAISQDRLKRIKQRLAEWLIQS